MLTKCVYTLMLETQTGNKPQYRYLAKTIKGWYYVLKDQKLEV